VTRLSLSNYIASSPPLAAVMSKPASAAESTSFPLRETKLKHHNTKHHTRTHSASPSISTSTSRGRDKGSASSSSAFGAIGRPLQIDIPDNDNDNMGIEYVEDECSPLKTDSPNSYFAIGDGGDEERLLNVTEIARRPGESLYIKKCLLVNAEIDRMGMVSDANNYWGCIWVCSG
jgi:hypothetical protein